MRWRVALRALCLAAAMAACVDGHGAPALETDDEDDEEAELIEKKPSRWAVMFEPALSTWSTFDFLTPVMPERLLYFTGFDIWRCGLGAYAGLQWAPNTVNKDGFILRVSGSESLEHFATPRKRYETEIFRGSVMPGIRIKRGNLEIQVLGGPDMQSDYLLTDRRLTAWRSRVGVRFAADTWWEPTRALMLQSSVSGTTIDNGINGRVAAGWRLFDRFWVGPEAAFSRDFFSRQYRIGAHFTGLRTGHYEWSVAAGYLQDSFQRDGIYVRLGILVRPPREPFFEN